MKVVLEEAVVNDDFQQQGRNQAKNDRHHDGASHRCDCSTVWAKKSDDSFDNYAINRLFFWCSHKVRLQIPMRRSGMVGV